MRSSNKPLGSRSKPPPSRPFRGRDLSVARRSTLSRTRKDARRTKSDAPGDRRLERLADGRVTPGEPTSTLLAIGNGAIHPALIEGERVPQALANRSCPDATCSLLVEHGGL